MESSRLAAPAVKSRRPRGEVASKRRTENGRAATFAIGAWKYGRASRHSVGVCYTHQITHRRRVASTAHERDVAQPGSAPDWGSGGRWFESSHPDQNL